jgi:hypothetical protein
MKVPEMKPETSIIKRKKYVLIVFGNKSNDQRAKVKGPFKMWKKKLYISFIRIVFL